MYNFDVERFRKVTDGAIALRPEIEKCVDGICRDGYKNIFLIGVGGTYAHYLPIKYMADSISRIDVHAEIAAEFMATENKHFDKDSVAIFCSRTGNTKEIVAAAEYCKQRGARTIAFVAHEGTPLTKIADHVFINYADDDHLGESIYLQIIPAVFRFFYNNGEFPDYDKMFSKVDLLTPYLLKAKEGVEDYARDMAEKHKDTGYFMVTGAGAAWGEAYDYAMCILEEMQWIKTKSIHSAEFFHGTLELVEKDTTILMLYGEDASRAQTDRVYSFASKITDDILKFDTADVELPVDREFRRYLTPMVLYTLLERFSCHLEHVRNHSLNMRRYYRQMEY